MGTEDKNQEKETLQMKKEKERKARSEIWLIEQQIKASAKFAEENGGS